MDESQEPGSDRRLFHERAFDIIKRAVAEASILVPELEGVGVVVLWRGIDPIANVPSLMIQGGDGPLKSADQFLRLNILAARLGLHALDGSIQGVEALRALASELARKARADHAATQTHTARAPEQQQENAPK